MGLREELQKRIDRKRVEIADLQSKLREATSYVQALEDTLKLLPKDTSAGESSRGAVDTMRPNSAVGRAREIMRRNGTPMHVDDLLRNFGKPVNKATRAALSGSLGVYVRKGIVFVKTAPNTFFLKELSGNNAGAAMDDDLPSNFGMDDIDEGAEAEEETEEEKSIA